MNGETTLVKEKPRSLLQVACKGYTKRGSKARVAAVFSKAKHNYAFLGCRIPVPPLLSRGLCDPNYIALSRSSL